MAGRTTSALLYLDAVSVSFDSFRALNDLSLTVEPGEMRAIIGRRRQQDHHDGCHHRQTRPDKGDVYFDGGSSITTLDETQIAELASGASSEADRVRDAHGRDICGWR